MASRSFAAKLAAMHEAAPDPQETTARRRAGLRAWRRWLPRAVFESGLIVFSVVLALLLSQWVEDRRQAHRVSEMRGFLAAEMRENRAMLLSQDYLPHHNRLKTNFYAAAGRQPDPVDAAATRVAMQTLMSSGWHPPQLRNAVWTSVSQGELIESMSPRDVFALAEVYRAQEELHDWSGHGVEVATDLLDILRDPDVAKGRLTRMVVFLEDITAQERRLIGFYDRTIAQLENRDPATEPSSLPRRGGPVTAPPQTG